MKKLVINQKIITWMLFAYFIFLILLSTQANEAFFDEMMDLGGSKYVSCLGSCGFLEYIRPVGLPIIFAPFSLLGLPFIFYKLFVMLIATLSIYLVIKIVKELSIDDHNKIVPYLIICCFIFSTFYPIYVIRPLNHVPAMFLMLVSAYLFLREHYLFSGIFAGACFLTRFSYGLMLPALGLSVLLATKFDKKSIYKMIVNGLTILLGFMIIVTPYFVYNYHRMDYPNLSTSERILKPLTDASTVLDGVYHPEGRGFTYYFTQLLQWNPFLIFGYIGLVYLLFKTKLRDRKWNIILLPFILFYFYLGTLAHKEIRYAYVLLPYVIIFTIIGFTKTFDWYINKFKLGNNNERNRILKGFIKTSAWIGIAVMIFSFVFFSILYLPCEFVDHQGIKDTLALTNKTIVTSTPVIAPYTSNEYIVTVSEPNAFFQTIELIQPEIIALDPYTWLDRSLGNPKELNNQKKYAIRTLLENYNLLFHGKINCNNSIIIVGNENHSANPNCSIEELYDKYIDIVMLSNNPTGKESINVIRLDYVGIGMFEDNNTMNIFIKINDFFSENNKTISWSIAPHEFVKLKQGTQDKIIDYYKNNSNIEIVHMDSNAATFKVANLLDQEQRIKQGKAILEDKFNTTINTYTTSYGYSDCETIKILSELDYDVFSSAGIDVIDKCEFFDIRNIPINSYIYDWRKANYKSYEQLVEEYNNRDKNIPIILQIETIERLLEEDKLDNYLTYLDDNHADIMSFNELNKWLDSSEQDDFSQQDNIIELEVQDIDQEKTIVFTQSDNYTFNSNLNTSKIYIKNLAPFDIEVCLNQDCQHLESKQEKKLN